MPQFAFNKIVIPIPWVTYDVPVITGRMSRKALIFASTNNGGNWRFDPSALNAANLADAMMYMPLLTVNLIMEYAVLGPLVQGAWYAHDGGAGVFLNVTEVYQI